jgi:hypothetical protein
LRPPNLAVRPGNNVWQLITVASTAIGDAM